MSKIRSISKAVCSNTYIFKNEKKNLIWSGVTSLPSRFAAFPSLKFTAGQAASMLLLVCSTVPYTWKWRKEFLLHIWKLCLEPKLLKTDAVCVEENRELTFQMVCRSPRTHEECTTISWLDGRRLCTNKPA